MKPYDFDREQIRQYFGSKYPYIVVAHKDVLDLPIDKNMHKSFTKTGENCMGQRYTEKIVGWGCSQVSARPDEKFILFYDERNRDIFVRENSALIITTDPFGPDQCSNCGGPAPERVNTLVEVPAKWWKFRWW